MDWLQFFGDAGSVALGAVIGAAGGYIVARINRDEARGARFADRIRELGAIVLDSAHRFTEAVNEANPRANLGEDVPRQIRELRLVVRNDATGLVLDEMLGCLSFLDHIREGGEGEDPSLRGPELLRSRDLQERLEDGLRRELGLPPAPREQIDF